MAVVLSLITAAMWGTSDFFGGLATKRRPVAEVMLWVHGIGLVAVSAVAPFLADTLTGRDLALGAIAGVFGLVGLLLLYWALSIGPMAVVAPLSALTAALLPVLWGLPGGDTLTITTVVGLLLGLAAVVAISWEGSPDDAPAVTPRIVAAAIVAGLGFGSIVLFYDAASDGSAPWPIVSGRVVTTILLLLFAIARRRSLAADRTCVAPQTDDQPRALSALKLPALAAVAGVGDTAANVTLLLATSAAVGSAELSVVAVVSAFFPAATVIWARFMLNERLGPVRLGGLGLGFAAIALMTIG